MEKISDQVQLHEDLQPAYDAWNGIGGRFIATCTLQCQNGVNGTQMGNVILKEKKDFDYCDVRELKDESCALTRAIDENRYAVKQLISNGQVRIPLSQLDGKKITAFEETKFRNYLSSGGMS